MMYCTHCGSDMKGSKSSCPVCGYRVDQMKVDLKTPRALKRPEPKEKKPWAPPIPDQRAGPIEEAEVVREVRMPPRKAVRFGGEDVLRGNIGDEGPDNADDDPTVVRGCSFCKARPELRCFFCQSPICRNHTDRLQIHVRSTAFGDVISSCPSCSEDKGGRMPTPAEAEDAGMLFSIKPYHVWTRVK
jgi:hypothetical protein